MLNKILIKFALFLLWLFSLLPMYVIRILGNGLGFIAYHLAKSRRNVGIINLTLCFPEMSEIDKQSIIKQHFKDLSTSMLEYGKMFYSSASQLCKIIKYKNSHYLTEYYKQKSIIFLCPHFVSLDLAAIRMTVDFMGYSIYSRQKTDYVTNILKNARQRFNAPKGGKIFSRNEGLRNIIKEMRRTKMPLFYLPDQDLGLQDSIFVPFFAHKTCATIDTLPKLAKLTDAVIIPMATYRNGNHYEVEFFPPWTDYPSGDIEQDVIRMNSFIEMSIMQAVPQYFWLHKRFKTQPDGRHKLYKKEQ